MKKLASTIYYNSNAIVCQKLRWLITNSSFSMETTGRIGVGASPNGRKVTCGSR